MDVPDLIPMGPQGYYMAHDRAVLSGRAFQAVGEFTSVPVAGERFLSITVDTDYMVVVWSVVVGVKSDTVGNKPITVTQYIGGLSGAAAAGIGNLLSGGPVASGFTAEAGDTLDAGSVKAFSFPYNFSGQNILNGIRVLKGSSPAITVGVSNDDAQVADLMTISALVAVFDKTTVEDVVL